MPLLLVRVLSAHTADGFCTTVSGQDLEDEGLPCLYYVDSSGYGLKHVERSGTLFPSEYINRDLLEERRTQLLDRKITSGIGEKANASAAEAPAHYFVNLEHHLLAPATTLTMRSAPSSELTPKMKSLLPGTDVGRKI
jgi:hypothetical protein